MLWPIAFWGSKSKMQETEHVLVDVGRKPGRFFISVARCMFDPSEARIKCRMMT